MSGKKNGNQKNLSDLINYNYTGSKKRTRMSRTDRAAQFSPFAALKGFEEAIEHSERITVDADLLDEHEKASIDRTLRELLTRTPVPVRMRLFVPDESRDGGAFRDFEDRLTGFDPISRELQFEKQGSIQLDYLYAIEEQRNTDQEEDHIDENG